jgi:dimethylamine/trimethylamine dehydrogenase
VTQTDLNPTAERYRVLFEPVQIGPVKAKNRFFAVAHRAGMGFAQPHATAALRGMQAEGGWGVVCTGVCEIDVELAHWGLGSRNLYSRVPTLGPASLKCTSAYVPVQSQDMSLTDIVAFRAAHRAAVYAGADYARNPGSASVPFLRERVRLQ